MGATSGRPGPDPLPREHGTVRGRLQHARRREEPCPPCRAARRADDREREQRQREAWAAIRNVRKAAR